MNGIFQWIQNYLMLYPLVSPILYVLLHMLFAICLIPCSPMTVIAGILWGKWLGLSISVFAAVLSSCCTFCLSRFFLKNRIYQFISKRYSKTDWFLDKTKEHGWKFVASVQLNPAAPGSALGYLFGLTHIKFSVYSFYLILFMLPPQLLLIIAGDSISKTIGLGNASWYYLELILVVFSVYLLYKMCAYKLSRSRLNE